MVTAVLPLLGLVSILNNRRKRKRGIVTPTDDEFEKRKAATRESERRMKAYLASRHQREDAEGEQP